MVSGVSLRALVLFSEFLSPRGLSVSALASAVKNFALKGLERRVTIKKAQGSPPPPLSAFLTAQVVSWVPAQVERFGLWFSSGYCRSPAFQTAPQGFLAALWGRGGGGGGMSTSDFFGVVAFHFSALCTLAGHRQRHRASYTASLLLSHLQVWVAWSLRAPSL